MATEAEIRASAKSLCFRACTDCTSADECDPDENWIKEALAILKRPGGLRGLVDGHKVAFDTRKTAAGTVRLPVKPGRAGTMTHDYKRDDHVVRRAERSRTVSVASAIK